MWTTLIQNLILIAGVFVMAAQKPDFIRLWVDSGLFSPAYIFSFPLLLIMGLA